MSISICLQRSNTGRIGFLCDCCEIKDSSVILARGICKLYGIGNATTKDFNEKSLFPFDSTSTYDKELNNSLTRIQARAKCSLIARELALNTDSSYHDNPFKQLEKDAIINKDSFFMMELAKYSAQINEKKKALRLCKEAADADNAEACFILGNAFYSNVSELDDIVGEEQKPEKNTKIAIEYWNRAAAMGYTEAMLQLARHYRKDGNIKKAKELCFSAIERGNSEANYVLLLCYENDAEASSLSSSSSIK